MAGVVGATVAVLMALDVPRPDDGADTSPFRIAMMLGLLFVIGPIAQWARAGRPLPFHGPMQLDKRNAFPVIAGMIAVVGSSYFLKFLAPAFDHATMLIGLAGLAVASQALHFVGLQWFYARRDLA